MACFHSAHSPLVRFPCFHRASSAPRFPPPSCQHLHEGKCKRGEKEKRKMKKRKKRKEKKGEKEKREN
jgi:hypothetical protein